MTERAPRRNPIRRLLGKGRRVTRKALLGGSGTVGQQQLDELWHWVNGMQGTVNRVGAQMADLQQTADGHTNQTAEHVDLVVDQLWRRLEAADARLATQLQRMAEDHGRRLADLEILAGRLRVENASVLRLIGHPEQIVADADEVAVANLPVARMTLFSEVERGSTDVLLHKLQQYVTFFEGATKPVIDLGCGKGDFLQLLSDAGVPGYGVDLDEDAIETAKSRGLDGRLEDLFQHLRDLPDGSLGGAFSSQVVEHLPAAVLATLYEELYRVVAPGGRVVVETPNPSTFATHVQSFWRDPTHIRPVPVSALDFAARSAGLVSEQTIYVSPSPQSDRLQRIDLQPADPLMAELVARFNANAERLDDVLFGYQDYALVCRRP